MRDLIGVASFDGCHLGLHIHLQTADVSLNHLWFDALELIWQFLFLFWVGICLLLATVFDSLLFDIRLFFIKMTLEIRFVIVIHVDTTNVLHEVWFVIFATLLFDEIWLVCLQGLRV